MEGRKERKARVASSLVVRLSVDGDSDSVSSPVSAFPRTEMSLLFRIHPRSIMQRVAQTAAGKTGVASSNNDLECGSQQRQTGDGEQKR